MAMPVAHYASPFSYKVELSLDEKEQLHTTTHELVDEVVELYEEFLWKNNSALDTARWSLLRERDDVRVFQDQRPTGEKDFYRFLAVGNVNGSLNDAMYGEFSDSTDAMRIKTAYTKDTVLDCAVLETILEPTNENPFQSMTVRWVVKGLPTLARAIAKHHDSVCLEATGMRALSNGERIGFHLIHSLTSPNTPKLPEYDRSNISACSIWRQVTPQTVHVFRNAVGYISDSKFAVPMAIKSISEALISVHRVLDCAQLKKLAYLANKTKSTPREGALPNGCTVCGAQTPCARRGVKSMCALCSTTTCGRCRVKRKIFSVGPDRRLLEFKMRFCTPCLSSATKLDAFEVAQGELHGKKSRNGWVRMRKATADTSSITSSISSASSRSLD